MTNSRSGYDPLDKAFAHLVDTIRLVLDVPFAAVAGLNQTDPVLERKLVALAAEALASDGPVQVGKITGLELQPGLPDPLNALVVPLRRPHAVVGALIVADGASRTFSDRETSILVQFARCIVTDLTLQERATTDDLTGLMRRQPFMSELQGLLTEFANSGAPASLSIIDLDHFKAVNDRFGHPMGDRVLRSVADTFRETMPADALVCRLGGEEFAVALADTPLEDAVPVFDTLRDAIAAQTFANRPPVRITASVGIAALSPALANVPAWCKMADAALYGAKQAGRNQTRIGLQEANATRLIAHLEPNLRVVGS